MSSAQTTERISRSMQTLAMALDETLAEIAGCRVAFVLTLEIDGVGQYVANVSEHEAVAMLRALVEAADEQAIGGPAHENPALHTSHLGKKGGNGD